MPFDVVSYPFVLFKLEHFNRSSSSLDYHKTFFDRAWRLSICEENYLVKGGTTGYKIWEASLLLAEYIYDKLLPDLEGKVVLELGAGTGLPSLLISAIGDPEKVIATDISQQVLDRLLLMKSLNEKILYKSLPLCFESLDWCNSNLDFLSHLDFAFAADTLYDPSLIPPFVFLLNQLSDRFGSSLKIFVALTERNEDTYRLVLQTLSDSCFSLETVPFIPLSYIFYPYYLENALSSIRLLRISKTKNPL